MSCYFHFFNQNLKNIFTSANRICKIISTHQIIQFLHLNLNKQRHKPQKSVYSAMTINTIVQYEAII